MRFRGCCCLLVLALASLYDGANLCGFAITGSSALHPRLRIAMPVHRASPINKNTRKASNRTNSSGDPFYSPDLSLRASYEGRASREESMEENGEMHPERQRVTHSDPARSASMKESNGSSGLPYFFEPRLSIPYRGSVGGDGPDDPPDDPPEDDHPNGNGDQSDSESDDESDDSDGSNDDDPGNMDADSTDGPRDSMLGRFLDEEEESTMQGDIDGAAEDESQNTDGLPILPAENTDGLTVTAADNLRRAQDTLRRAQDASRRAQDNLRRAQERSKALKDNSRRAQDASRRAQDNLRRAQERSKALKDNSRRAQERLKVLKDTSRRAQER
eukprot:TRINITY_DN17340_c0_g1_i3.p1 TRINITY_DN17340_c0_g1~~TRINITY_DN17340_c0_g1_i3.p1  ORF type:complete len:331 (-),score=60.13 TRINITY_DN17340_c0_g1_i3:118-1110(-)